MNRHHFWKSWGAYRRSSRPGFHIFEMAGIRRMGQEPGFGELIVVDQVVFMGMEVTRKSTRPRLLKASSLSESLAASMTARTRLSTSTELQWGNGPADEFYRALGEIVQFMVFPLYLLWRGSSLKFEIRISKSEINLNVQISIQGTSCFEHFGFEFWYCSNFVLRHSNLTLDCFFHPQAGDLLAAVSSSPARTSSVFSPNRGSAFSSFTGVRRA